MIEHDEIREIMSIGGDRAEPPTDARADARGPAEALASRAARRARE